MPPKSSVSGEVPSTLPRKPSLSDIWITSASFGGLGPRPVPTLTITSGASSRPRRPIPALTPPTSRRMPPGSPNKIQGVGGRAANSMAASNVVRPGAANALTPLGLISAPNAPSRSKPPRTLSENTLLSGPPPPMKLPLARGANASPAGNCPGLPCGGTGISTKPSSARPERSALGTDASGNVS
jgi:hypothetical protein